MEKQLEIRNFKRTSTFRYHKVWDVSLACAETFEAELEGNGSLDQIINAISMKIPTGDYTERDIAKVSDGIWSIFGSGSGAIQSAYDEKTGYGAFVMTEAYGRGNKGLYAIKKAGEKITGWLVDYRPKGFDFGLAIKPNGLVGKVLEYEVVNNEGMGKTKLVRNNRSVDLEKKESNAYDYIHFRSCGGN